MPEYKIKTRQVESATRTRFYADLYEVMNEHTDRYINSGVSLVSDLSAAENAVHLAADREAGL